jgi:predicted metal-dependent enzyme (double-stranded beta helix superfamily)
VTKISSMAVPLHLTYLEVGTAGQCGPVPLSVGMDSFPERHPYRFCRFLCDLEDLVERVTDDRIRIRTAALLVQRLLAQATWITDACPTPDPSKGMAIRRLYREPGYPFTIKLVSWLPGIQSPVHNHAAWSIVAILGDATCGHEKNQFWQRQDDGSRPDFAQLQIASEWTLKPGNILGLTPGAIHSIESVSASGEQKPTYTFNVYGKANLKERFVFDPATHRVRHH